MPTLYAGWMPWKARTLIAAILILAMFSALPGSHQAGVPAAQPTSDDYNDQLLYRDIVRDMVGGAGYYESAANAHRAHHYPTAPALVFREPALAWMMAVLRFDLLRHAALYALFCADFLGVFAALAATGVQRRERFIALTIAMTGLAVVGVPDAIYSHEVWASLLIFASLMVYRKDRWVSSVLLGMAACLFREIALPYLCAMGMFAILEKRWIEAIGWAGGIMALSLIFAIHDYFASQLYHPGDLISASWLAAGGLRFALDSARWNIAFHALPAPLLVLALACALIGLTASKDPRAWRAAFVVMGYLAAFLFIGRPDNDYWGILYTPLLPLGFMYTPRALRDLWSSARRENKTVPR